MTSPTHRLLVSVSLCSPSSTLSLGWLVTCFNRKNTAGVIWPVPGLGLKKVWQLLLVCSGKPAAPQEVRLSCWEERGHGENSERPQIPHGDNQGAQPTMRTGPQMVTQGPFQPAPCHLSHPSWVRCHPGVCPSWHHMEERYALPTILYPNYWPTELWEKNKMVVVFKATKFYRSLFCSSK